MPETLARVLDVCDASCVHISVCRNCTDCVNVCMYVCVLLCKESSSFYAG